MSNKTNHRRGEHRRTEHGPRFENPNPGAGCNSTHVARSRAKWKAIKNRSLRRNGVATPKYHEMKRGAPMNKREAIGVFKEMHAYHSFISKVDGRLDKPARRQAWNDYTDYLHKDNKITSKQYDRWIYPFND